MLSPNDPLFGGRLVEERRAALLREVEKERLARLALDSASQSNPAHRRALAWLGGQLVAWAGKLQQRYGAGAVMPRTRFT